MKTKVTIEVGHGWVGSLVRCDYCLYEFTCIRERTALPYGVCPACGRRGNLSKTELPWTGVIEEVVENG